MVFYDGSGAPALYAGNTSDNRNYYQSNHHRFRSDDANTNFAELSSAGLRIGSASAPSEKLHVVGDVKIEGLNPTIYLNDTNGADWNIDLEDNHLRFKVDSTGTATATTFVGGGIPTPVRSGALTSANSMTYSHGQSSAPDLVWGELHITTADDNYSVGDVITHTHDGVDLPATIEKEKDIKHAQCKVSDSAESKSVYGAFVAWDNDSIDTVNDILVAQTGTFVIRIHKDETVSKGDLIQSKGDGTGKVQADDIIRASTVAKVLSTTKIETYDDGSFIVPCSLMC